MVLQLEKKKQKFEILLNTVLELSLAKDMELVTKIVRSAARKLVGADGVTIVLRDHDLCYYIDEEAITPLWKGQKFPLTACISGWCILNKEKAIIKDIYVDNRIPINAYKTTFVKSLMMVPIRKAEPIGSIGSYWASQYVPPAEDIKLMQSLADITAVTIENILALPQHEHKTPEQDEVFQILNKELGTTSSNMNNTLQWKNREERQYKKGLDILHRLTDFLK
jgi:hypothetical protein